MPSLYLPSMQRHLTLTPPDCIYYPLDGTNLPPVQDGYYYDIGGQGLPNDIYDAHGIRKLAKFNGVPARKDSLFDRPQLHSHQFPQTTRRENPFGPIAPPMLPPLRIPDNMDRSRQMHVGGAPRVQHQQPPKEEKASGGVAVHLDYEMDQMVDFVAEMAKGMYDLSSRLNIADIDVSRSVLPGMAVPSSFRSFVSQLLTATRLPSSTILCALSYLAGRMTLLSERGFHPTSSSQLHQMTTVALMIASKFLDDNTFQNRSWSDVSRISVTELNKHEMEWLMAMEWDLHADVRNSSGLVSWISKWNAYKAQKEELSLEALRLTSADMCGRVPVSAVGHRYSPQTPAFTPYTESPYALSTREPSAWQPWRSSHSLSPPSANQSGPATPDWYPRGGYGPMPAVAGWSSGPGPLPPLSSIRSAAPSPYYSSYPQHYGYNTWAHGPGCGCGYCAVPQERYSMGHSYGVQPVIG